MLLLLGVTLVMALYVVVVGFSSLSHPSLLLTQLIPPIRVTAWAGLLWVLIPLAP